MSLSADEVKKIAYLARLGIDETDIDASQKTFHDLGINNSVIGAIQASNETEPHIEYMR